MDFSLRLESHTHPISKSGQFYLLNTSLTCRLLFMAPTLIQYYPQRPFPSSFCSPSLLPPHHSRVIFLNSKDNPCLNKGKQRISQEKREVKECSFVARRDWGVFTS